MAKIDSFDELLNYKPDWPQAGDKLFFGLTETGFGSKRAQHNNLLFQQREGYKTGADLMLQEAMKHGNRWGQLAYPVIFCYRHFLELTLKYFVHEFGSPHRMKAKWSTHKLDKLWQDFRALVKKHGMSPADEKATNAVEKCILEFAKIDPTSTKFRYPSDGKGEIFDIECEFLNAQNLHDVMKKIEGYFMGCEGALDYERDVREDYEAYLSGNY